MMRPVGNSLEHLKCGRRTGRVPPTLQQAGILGTVRARRSSPGCTAKQFEHAKTARWQGPTEPQRHLREDPGLHARLDRPARVAPE